MWLFRHTPLSVYRWPVIGYPLSRLAAKWQHAEHKRLRELGPVLTDQEIDDLMRAVRDY